MELLFDVNSALKNIFCQIKILFLDTLSEEICDNKFLNFVSSNNLVPLKYFVWETEVFSIEWNEKTSLLGVVATTI